MKKLFLKYCIAILFFTGNIARSQVTTIDYSNYSSSQCNVFGAGTAISGITHQSVLGQPTFNNSNHSVRLDYSDINNAKNGTQFKIVFTLKKDYSYRVIVTARNIYSSAPSSAVELKINYAASSYSISNHCSGAETISAAGNAFSSDNTPISNTNFQDYDYGVFTAQTNSNDILFSTYTPNIATPNNQAIEISKIVITEIPPLPIFTLSPTTKSISCGSITPVTFSVTNVYKSPGTLTYDWDIGAGWSGTVNSSMSSITLTPNSTSSIPSSVSVTPYLNGVAQPTKSCVVSIASFTPNASINTGSICIVGDTKTYAINGLPPGCTVNWSSTNTTVATVASGTNSLVVMQSQSSGTFTIKATVLNSCGQPFDIYSQSINVGLGSDAPIAVGSNCYSNSASPCIINNPSHTSGWSANIELTSPTMENANTYSDWEWENISGRFAFSGMYVNGNKAYGNTMGINFLNNTIPNQIEFRCRVQNSCGWSNWKSFIITYSDGAPVVVPPVTPPPPPEYYIISPNPTSSYANIMLKNSSIIPPNTLGLYVSVFTTSGSLVINDTWINSNTGGSLYIGNLASNTGYLLKIKSNNNNIMETKYLMKN